MTAHPSTWLVILSWFSLALAGIAAAEILWDVYGRGTGRRWASWRPCGR